MPDTRPQVEQNDSVDFGSLDQLARGHIEGASNRTKCVQIRSVILSSLPQLDVFHGNLGFLSKVLLREPTFLSTIAQRLTERTRQFAICTHEHPSIDSCLSSAPLQKGKKHTSRNDDSYRWTTSLVAGETVKLAYSVVRFVPW